MERVREIHESNEKFYRKMFRTDVILLVLIVVIAIPCNLFSGTVCLIERTMVLVILNALLFALNAFNGVTTVKRMIRRYNDRKLENAAYNALVALERCCTEEETEV